MTKLTKEPLIIQSMPELLATAKAMESEAIAGYEALADQMRHAGKPELVAVFERLVAEERGHLASVVDWSSHLGMANLAAGEEPDEVFDNEGMNLTDPALLSAYRAFSIAVRNEERAFLFWTYVSAHAPASEIAHAAERMAREELGHVSTLRRERRLAFHLQRRMKTERIGLDQLESELDTHLQTLIKRKHPDLERLAALLQECRERFAVVEGRSIELEIPTEVADISPTTLAELILDYYLAEAEHAKEEESRNGAQVCAGQLVATLALLRRTRLT